MLTPGGAEGVGGGSGGDVTVAVVAQEAEFAPGTCGLTYVFVLGGTWRHSCTQHQSFHCARSCSCSFELGKC